MFRKLAGIAAGLALTAAVAVAAPAPASAHTNAQADAVCDWIEVRHWGTPNNITQLINSPTHLYGSHQAFCVYGVLGSTINHVCVYVDFYSGYEAWSYNCLF